MKLKVNVNKFLRLSNAFLVLVCLLIFCGKKVDCNVQGDILFFLKMIIFGKEVYL